MESSNAKIIAAFLAGAAAGASLGLLLAPDKGENTRRQVRESLEELGLKAKVSLEDFGGKAKGSIEELSVKAKGSINDLTDKARTTYEKYSKKDEVAAE